MRAEMMDVPLSVTSILRHAAEHHGRTEIVSRLAGGEIHRTDYARVWRRSQQLANALRRLGLRNGDRVGTLAWNSYRHLEVYFGTAGAGFACHTINPRLFAEQITFIANHAEDRVLLVDPAFAGLVEAIADKLTSVEVVVVMTDAAHMPAVKAGRARVACYEELLAAEPERFDWPEHDENSAAALCYTSGTTGDPKGVLYSHRSIVLHALSVCVPDVFALGASSVVMPVVPMFHVNAWGLPYAAPLSGAKLVLPGPRLDPTSLHDLITREGVTHTAGVPTVWTALLDWAAANGKSFGTLKRMAVGGSACPPVMFERFRDHGVFVVHAWGMTETSPLALANTPKSTSAARSPAEEVAFAAKQGRPLFGVELRVVDAADNEIAHDGVAFGALLVRGPWVASGYYGLSQSPTHRADGWFETGDVVTMDAEGYVQVVDRTKDVIKSGGEWISSIDLEAIAMSHPGVLEAAVVARPDARWGERPLLVVVRRPGATVDEQALLAHYEGKVARWWVPDSATFVDELPHTATGKLLKSKIRELYAAPKT